MSIGKENGELKKDSYVPLNSEKTFKKITKLSTTTKGIKKKVYKSIDKPEELSTSKLSSNTYR